MFPKRFFPNRYFSPSYWDNGLTASVVVVGASYYLRTPLTLGKVGGTFVASGSPTAWTINTQVQS